MAKKIPQQQQGRGALNMRLFSVVGFLEYLNRSRAFEAIDDFFYSTCDWVWPTKKYEPHESEYGYNYVYSDIRSEVDRIRQETYQRTQESHQKVQDALDRATEEVDRITGKRAEIVYLPRSYGHTKEEINRINDGLVRKILLKKRLKMNPNDEGAKEELMMLTMGRKGYCRWKKTKATSRRREDLGTTLSNLFPNEPSGATAYESFYNKRIYLLGLFKAEVERMKLLVKTPNSKKTKGGRGVQKQNDSKSQYITQRNSQGASGPKQISTLA